MKRSFPACLLALLVVALPPRAHAQNQPPVAVNDTVTVFLGIDAFIRVLDNDTDPDGDDLEVERLTKNPKWGTFTVYPDEIVYRATNSQRTSDSFTYEISDDNGATDRADVFITIKQRPVAEDDEASLFSHESVEVDVLDNDSDPDADPLHVDQLLLLPEHGAAMIVGDSRIAYEPEVTFEGRDSLSYVVADVDALTDTAFVFFEVTINQPPVATNDSLTTLINAPLEIGVLANDTDEEDDALFVHSISMAPENGEAAIVDGIRIRYTPKPGFLGSDSLEYAISDGVPRNGSPIADRAKVILQVLPRNGAFEAMLSGTNEVPATRSRATGLIVATLQGAQLSFSGAFNRLDSDFARDIGANLYLGLTGERGEVLLPLTVSLNPGNRSGVLNSEDNTFTLTNDELQALFDRRLYVNIHSEALLDGAVRGQLLPAEPTAVFRAVLSGRAENPANRSQAVGGVVAERYGNLLIVSGAFSGLEFAVSKQQGQPGVRIYRGDPGVNGQAVFDLEVDLSTDRRSGAISTEQNAFLLTEDQIRLLDDGLFYVNVHTIDRPGGAIRGQFQPLSTRMFEAFLTPANEVPPLQASGQGSIVGWLDGTTLTVTGVLEGLGSAVDLNLQNGAHIHQGAPNANGEIQLELAPLLDSGRRSGIFPSGSNVLDLTPDNLNALFEGHLYVNIHTLDHPEGVLRGQLLPSTNVAPGTASTASPVDGDAVDVSGDPDEAFVPRWFPAVDVNGNLRFYRWQLALDTGFQTVIMESDLIPETQFETTVEAVVEALAARGISPADNVQAFHRVVSTDGSLRTPGPAARVILGDGTVTSVDDAGVPERFAVRGNYPNPFNPTTTIHVDLPQPARVYVEVFDLLGRRVLTTPAQELEAGAGRAVPVDASALGSGVYLYHIVARAATDTFTDTGRMTLVK